MCEFKVFDQGRLVANDIVYANLSNGVLILKDVLGSATSVEEAVIAEIDVTKEAMRLKRDPLIGDMLRFLDAATRCEESGKYDKSLEDNWLKVKSQGDERIRKLWRNFENLRQEKAVR